MKPPLITLPTLAALLLPIITTPLLSAEKTAGAPCPAPVCATYTICTTVQPPDPYRQVQDEVARLNHAFYPISTAIYGYASSCRPDKKLVTLDERVAKVNAEVILREHSPERILRDIRALYRDIDRLAPRTLRYGALEYCRDTLP